jgi:WD40 repeat protein
MKIKGKYAVRNSLQRPVVQTLIFVLFCASCSTPTSTPIEKDQDVLPSPVINETLDTLLPTEEPTNTPLPIPTSKPKLEINFENANRLLPQVTIQEESEWIYNLAFSADGSLITGAANRSELNVWNVEDGSLEVTLSGHNARINSVAFSPDGKYLATGSQDTSIIIWSVSDWSILKRLEAHESFVNTLAFSPDSKLLASGGEDRRVILWQVESGEILHRLEEPIQRVGDVAFSSDGGLIAAASSENRARVWLVGNGELLWTLLGPNGIYRIAFSPHGSILATGSWSVVPFAGDPTAPIIFWDMSDGSQIRQSSEKTVAFSMVYSPDGELLFSGTEGNFSVQVWRVVDGALIWELMGHQERVTAVAINAQGTRLASGDMSGKIILWWLPEG